MDPVLEHHYNNIKEGKTRQDKDGYINTVVTIQVDKIKKLNNGKPTLIPTVYNGKIVSEEEAIKKAIDSGKKWTSSDTHKQLREYDKKLHKQMSPELAKGTFNKGGTTMKNDPPVGSTPSEVADDIPAMISEGEFVIPADVVRYIGLDKIREIMHQAKHGLACMEDEGLIVDVDEEGRPQSDQKEKSDDNVAIIETVQIEKVDPMMTQMAEGGMTDKDSPVTSPILNPDSKPVMNQGGMVIAPDGSLRMAEGGMPMQMDQMMREGASDPMMEQMPDEMAMPPELADEMAPQESEPMPEAPMMNAPVAQEFKGVPHLMAYLQEDEIKALQEAGRGLDENGQQMLSPEGIPVFLGNEGNETGGRDGGDADPSEPTDGGTGPSGVTGSDPADQGRGPGNEAPGDPNSENQAEEFKQISKEIKEELSPEKQDKTYVAGVGFIDKYIKERTSRPNPLQGKPAYAVATVAKGGLMRTPLYLDEGGFVPNIDKDGEINEAVQGEDPVASPSSPVASAVAESPVASEAVAMEDPVSSPTSKGLMQPDGTITGDNGSVEGLRNSLRQIGGINQPTIDYLSNNFDVADSIIGDEATGGAEIDGATINAGALKHFNEFGKNEDRVGDGLYQAQERIPEMFLEDGNPNQLIETQNIAKILDKQPDIDDASLDYLTENTDVFRDAEGRVNSEEGATYDGVAKEHYNLYGKAEGDRRGTEGLASFFSRPDLEEDNIMQDTMTDESRAKIDEFNRANPVTDDSSNTEGDGEAIGEVKYSSNMFDEKGDIQNAGENAMSVPRGGYNSGNPAPDPDLALQTALKSEKEGGTGFFTRATLQLWKDKVSGVDTGGLSTDIKDDFDSQFVHKGGNTYDFREGADIAGYLGKFYDINGNLTSIDNAVYQVGAKKGQPLTLRDVVQIGAGSLSNLESQFAGQENRGDQDETP